jgi:hypothetical protein
MSETSDTASTTPGWYPDSNEDTADEIYWDGEKWHGRRKKAADPSKRVSIPHFIKQHQKYLWVFLVAFLPLTGTVVQALLTAQAQAEQAQENFTLAQRKETYAAFDGAIERFRAALWAEIRLVSIGPSPDSSNPLFPPLKETPGEDVEDLVSAESKIAFYGSEDAHKKASEVLLQIWVVRAPLLGFISLHPNYPHLSDEQRGEFAKIVPNISDLIRDRLRPAQQKFRDAARTDLHLPLLPPDSIDPLYPYPPAAAATAIPAPPTVGQGPPGR